MYNDILNKHMSIHVYDKFLHFFTTPGWAYPAVSRYIECRFVVVRKKGY